MSPLETPGRTNQLSFKALDITTFQIPTFNCLQQIKLPRNIRYGTIKDFNDHQISAFHIALNHQDVYFCQKQRKSKGKVP